VITFVVWLALGSPTSAIAVWHMLTHQVPYQNLGPDY
jgi:hypothetical protein